MYPQRLVDQTKNYTIEFTFNYLAGSTTDWKLENKEIGDNGNMVSGNNAVAIECYSALAPTECALVKADGSWTQNTSKLSAVFNRAKIDLITSSVEQIVVVNESTYGSFLSVH